MARFHTGNHRLPVKILGYDGINKTRRLCQKCNKGDIGDECHYILVLHCTYFKQQRKAF